MRINNDFNVDLPRFIRDALSMQLPARCLVNQTTSVQVSLLVSSSKSNSPLFTYIVEDETNRTVDSQSLVCSKIYVIANTRQVISQTPP
ncbi:hypothetical protein HN011_009810, partial [Eciton burchellii]